MGCFSFKVFDAEIFVFAILECMDAVLRGSMFDDENITLNRSN